MAYSGIDFFGKKVSSCQYQKYRGTTYYKKISLTDCHLFPVRCVPENVFFEYSLNDDENFMVGKTEGNIMVTCKKDEKKIGNFCDVKITKAHRTKLEGILF